MRKSNNPEVGTAIAWLLLFAMLAGGSVYKRTFATAPIVAVAAR